MLYNNKPNSKIFVYLTFFGIIFILFGNTQINLFQVYSQEESQNQTKINSIILTAKLFGETYKWTEDDDNKFVNPTLNLTSGIDNQITVKSLQNDSEEHEIIIEGITSDGDKEELVASDEIKGGSSNTIKFNPEDVQDEDYQLFEYYCEYHPDTMRGKISIIQ
jgi:plastocyanin